MKNKENFVVLLVGMAVLTIIVVVGLFFFYPKQDKKPSVPDGLPGLTVVGVRKIGNITYEGVIYEGHKFLYASSPGGITSVVEVGVAK